MSLPTPVARQREVVCLPAKGHQVVLGTAGSGKTTMAILRSAYLADPDLPNSGRSLLLSFNKSLCDYIRGISDNNLRNVTVEHYHKFARGYLNSRGKMRYNAIIQGAERESAIATSVSNVKTLNEQSPLFRRPITFFDQEISWLFRNGISTLDDYQSRDRIGRADTRLDRLLRPVMWAVRNEYLNERDRRGYLYDFDDIATHVYNELEEDVSERFYKHIIIDEGQDLSPEMLRSLANAVPAAGSVNFFGDVAQQIYGHRMSWRSAGLTPDRVWEFKENYRNSAAIAALGFAIARMPYYAGVPDMVEPSPPRAAGPKPTLVKFNESATEVAFIVAQAQSLAETQSVAVLTRTVRQLNFIKSYLRGAINLRSGSSRWSDGPSLFCGTYHSAKGLEFNAVILPYLSAESFPDPQYTEDFGQEEANANDGRLLYVGVTRAKRLLIITYKNTPSHLLPPHPELYTVLER